MFRRAVRCLLRCPLPTVLPSRGGALPGGVLPKSGSLSDLECRYEAYLCRPELDGWELRKALDELHAMDAVPAPQLVVAALRACRRVGDFALAVRLLEAVKFKCGPHEATIWPYMLQEIRPTLSELGVNTPEELGYDQPELWLHDVQA